MPKHPFQLKIPEATIVDTFNYIYDFWPELTMDGSLLALPLSNKWVKPGGFLDMFFYWDSFFISLGLVVQGKFNLAMGILENLLYTIEKVGFVPNYIGKTVCKSRSQPPFLTSFIKELYKYRSDNDWLKIVVNKVEKEYKNYWLKPPHLAKIFGIECWVISKEDFILNKLVVGGWQDYIDALGCWLRFPEELDKKYLEKISKELGIQQEYTLLKSGIDDPDEFFNKLKGI
ncbi:MAG: hypothetical protein EAX91_12465 [Candidatus Lokiarchaeota archaeon]|nr:hypothetical protein [Candidatus Lokiarchaeota archaeon]